jgi:ParB family chromosome partitioning protein
MSTLSKSAFQMLPLSRLHESLTNPRRAFDEAKLLELAASLKAQGLIQPIVARPNADGFEIVAGARRYRAAQLSAHVQREVAAKPELVQIETAYRSPKERQPGTLSRNEYTDLEASADDSEDGENVPPCETSKTAIVVYGDGAGTTRKVCTDPNCPVHHPRRVVPVDPEAEARQREIEKEQAQRKRLLKRRTESFNRILDNAPASFTGPQLRVFLRALINIDAYDFTDDVAAHFVADDESNQQSAEEVLLSVMDGMEDGRLPAFALRLALTGHVDIPREGETDHLIEAEKWFTPAQPKKATKKPSANATKNQANAKTKSAKKKSSKRVAA